MKKVLLVVLFILSVGGLSAQVLPYGYAPKQMPAEDIAGQGIGDKSDYFAAAILLDPAVDAAWNRLQGLQILGVRCFLRNEYTQKRNKWSYVNVSQKTPDNEVAKKVENFTEGWNDVYFDTPVTIGAEPLYVGFQVYETKGSPYPACTYMGASVPNGCYINTRRAGWNSYDDRGTLYIFALVDSAAAVSRLKQTVYAQNTTHPQTVAPSEEFRGGLYLRNFGTDPVSSVEISMQGKGDETPKLSTVKLSTPLAAYDGTTLNTRFRAGAQQGTKMPFTVEVTKVNESEAQAAMPGKTWLFVTQDNFTRYPLIEEFTSRYCTACPFMIYYLDLAMEQFDHPTYYVTHHSGFRYDEFTTDVDKEMEYLFENDPSNPKVMYDRTIFPGETKLLYGASEASATPYLEAIKTAASLPAKASVNVQATQVGDKVSVNVSGRIAHDLVNESLYLSTYLVEDGISIDKYPQYGMDVEDAPEDLLTRFKHNGIIRHNFASENMGDRLTVNSDGTYDVTLPEVALSSNWVATNCRIVSFVHRLNKSGIRNNEVLNTGGKALSSVDGIENLRPADASSKSLDFYDVSGRKLGTMPTKSGIYIFGGKKVMVR